MSTSENPVATTNFAKLTAVMVGVTGVLQAVMGGMTAFGVESIKGTHGIVGMVTFGFTLVAAVAAYLSSRTTGNKGLFMHAVGMAVLALVQVGLGEMGLETLHITVGVAYTLGAIALPIMAYQRPNA